MATIRLADLNASDRDGFVAVLGDVVEHSPWVAAHAYTAHPFPDREAVLGAFCAALRSASEAEQLAVLRAHPDLAGRAAVAGEVGALSRAEQESVGLASLTPAEHAMFLELNEAYRVKFGFPFVLAVRGATKEEVLQAFEQRLPNDPETEFRRALAEVELIVRFRLDDRIVD